MSLFARLLVAGVLLTFGTAQAGLIQGVGFTQVGASFTSGANYQETGFSNTGQVGVDFTYLGVFDVPTLSITGTFGIFDGTSEPLGPNQKVDGPLSFRFTDATISCFGGTGSCSSFRLDFYAFYSLAFDPSLRLPVLVDSYIGLEGTSNLSSLGTTLQVSNSSVIKPSLGPSFAVLQNLAKTQIASNMPLLHFSWTVGEMPTGSTINLPGSLWYSFEQTAADIPEPGTIGLAAAVLAGLYWMRRQGRMG